MTDYNLNGNTDAAPATPLGQMMEGLGYPLRPVAEDTPYIEGTEITPPDPPAAGGFRIFAQDNGAGKTQLMVLFATGAAQQIAIEP